MCRGPDSSGSESAQVPAPEIPWASHNLGPATVLYGNDPDKLEIRFLLADGRSRDTEEAGLLQGDTVKFLVPVVGDPMTA